jgi:hypothetical protein
MARRSWDSLSNNYRERLSRGGVTRGQYESGASLSRARGHGATPEHPREAYKRPERYSGYIRKRESRPLPGETPEDAAYSLNMARDNAYRNTVGRLGSYIKFNADIVRVNVYGGIGTDGEDRIGMSLSQAVWTSHADAEELRSRAEEQYRGNPWWYH